MAPLRYCTVVMGSNPVSLAILLDGCRFIVYCVKLYKGGGVYRNRIIYVLKSLTNVCCTLVPLAKAVSLRPPGDAMCP